MTSAVVVLSHFYGLHGFSDRQLKRMKKGIEVFWVKKADFIIGTGGYGFFNRSKMSLGERSAIYFKEAGIKAEEVLYEGKSRNTVENLEETVKLAELYGINKLIIVTSFDHMLRTKYLTRKIVPEKIEREFVISDYYSTLKVTVWDFFWHIGGWIKIGMGWLGKKL